MASMLEEGGSRSRIYDRCPYATNSREIRGGSTTAATSKMERFVIIVNGFKPLTIIRKRSILDVAAVLDPPLEMYQRWNVCHEIHQHAKANNKYMRL